MCKAHPDDYYQPNPDYIDNLPLNHWTDLLFTHAYPLTQQLELEISQGQPLLGLVKGYLFQHLNQAYAILCLEPATITNLQDLADLLMDGREVTTNEANFDDLTVNLGLDGDYDASAYISQLVGLPANQIIFFEA